MADPIVENNGGAAPKTGYEDKPMDELKQLLESEQDVEKQRSINRELFGRAHRAEEKLKGGGDGGTPSRPAIKPESGEKKEAWEELAELQATGLPPADLVELGKLARRVKMTPMEVLNDPIMKAGFLATRKKETVASRTFSPDRRINGGGGSAPRSPVNEKDTPGTASARAAFNSKLSSEEESSE